MPTHRVNFVVATEFLVQAWFDLFRSVLMARFQLLKPIMFVQANISNHHRDETMLLSRFEKFRFEV